MLPSSGTVSASLTQRPSAWVKRNIFDTTLSSTLTSTVFSVVDTPAIEARSAGSNTTASSGVSVSKLAIGPATSAPWR